MKTKLTLLISIFILSISASAQTGTGIVIPSMSACDSLVYHFIDDNDIEGASIAIAKDGKLIYNRAFGYADSAGVETQPHHLWRLGSISKSITSITIMHMMDAGLLGLSDLVFGPGGHLAAWLVAPAQDDIVIADSDTAYINSITVKHLLDHTAGFDPGCNLWGTLDCAPCAIFPCSPVINPLCVAEANGTPDIPSTSKDMIKFMLNMGADHSPGTLWQYSNEGYVMLGQMIEEISGMSYEAYVKQEILEPLGICDMHIANNYKHEKMEREVEYFDEDIGCDFINGEDMVPYQYGATNYKAYQPAGAWIASTKDLVKLLVAVDGFTTKPDILLPATIVTMTTSTPPASGFDYALGWIIDNISCFPIMGTVDCVWNSGTNDGVQAYFGNRADGYSFAIVVNKELGGFGPPCNLGYQLSKLPWECIAATQSFPTHDLLLDPTINSDGLNFTELSNNAVTVNWINGNGDNSIVAISKSTIASFPNDGTNYEAGADLGNETYVVYNGSENSVNVTGLDADTEYFFRVFDYNQSANTGDYELYKLCGNSEASMTTLLTSIKKLSGEDRIMVFPSPTQNTLNIHLPYTETVQYQIFSATGQLMREGNWNCKECEINISNFNSGMYWIIIDKDGVESARKKFVVN